MKKQEAIEAWIEKTLINDDYMGAVAQVAEQMFSKNPQPLPWSVVKHAWLAATSSYSLSIDKTFNCLKHCKRLFLFTYLNCQKTNFTVAVCFALHMNNSVTALRYTRGRCPFIDYNIFNFKE